MLLAVMAHPDDAEIWAGGVLADAASAAGSHILVASQDDVRREEAIEGAAVLGAGIDVLESMTVQAVQDALTRLSPTVVVTHRVDDPHRDHRDVFELVMAALPDVVIETALPRSVYTCDTYNSLTLGGRVPGQVVVDVSRYSKIKLAALAKHQSQPTAHFCAMATRLGEYWGATRGFRFGEAFDPVPVLGRLPGQATLR